MYSLSDHRASLLFFSLVNTTLSSLCQIFAGCSRYRHKDIEGKIPHFRELMQKQMMSLIYTFFFF